MQNISSDHDLLISLNTKVDQVLTLQTDLVTRIAKAENRLDTMDIYHARINYDQLVPLITWTENFRANYKFLLFLGGLLIGILGGVVSDFIQKTFHF